MNDSVQTEATQDEANQTQEQLAAMEPTPHQKFFTLCNIGANILAAEVARACCSGQVALVQNIPADHLLWTRDYLTVSKELRMEQEKQEGQTHDPQAPYVQNIDKQLAWINRVISLRENPNQIVLPPTKPVVANIRQGLHVKKGASQ